MLELEVDLAERVRSALIECALAAYADAGVRGLCCEGAWEAALSALRQLDLAPLCVPEPGPPESGPPESARVKSAPR